MTAAEESGGGGFLIIALAVAKLDRVEVGGVRVCGCVWFILFVYCP